METRGSTVHVLLHPRGVSIVIQSLLLFLALLGAARAALFVINRSVVGQKHESKNMQILMATAPPALLVLTLCMIPFARSFGSGNLTTVAIIGGAWFAITIAIGVWWITDRMRQLLFPLRIAGVVTEPPVIRPLRKAHMPFASLRRAGLHNDVYDLEITRHHVHIADLPPQFEGFRIAFLSDTHVASFMRRELYRECVRQITAFGADVILLGGDYVTFRRDIPLMGEWLLDGLTARHGVYAVPGNHDYWADAEEVAGTFRRHGVRMLMNERVAIEIGGRRIFIAGIDEIYRGEPDADAALEGLLPNDAVIAISHHPDIIPTLRRRRIDLLLCGHTHGGQIRVPFFGPIVVPSRHEARYAAGFSRTGSVLAYVGRGIGAVPPLRILCRPELPLFTLTGTSSSATRF